jgi:hypothetical protein
MASLSTAWSSQLLLHRNGRRRLYACVRAFPAGLARRLPREQTKVASAWWCAACRPRRVLRLRNRQGLLLGHGCSHQPLFGHRQGLARRHDDVVQHAHVHQRQGVFRVWVSASSARLGCTLPLGWLCASTTAAAWWCRARSTTSRGYTLVCVSVPRNSSSSASRRFWLSRNSTANTSCPAPGAAAGSA